MTDEAIDEAMNWKDTWDAEKRKILLCVEYYRMGGGISSVWWQKHW